MNPNQYTLVKHTILPLIYRVVHPEIHQITYLIKDPQNNSLLMFGSNLQTITTFMNHQKQSLEEIQYESKSKLKHVFLNHHKPGKILNYVPSTREEKIITPQIQGDLKPFIIGDLSVCFIDAKGYQNPFSLIAVTHLTQSSTKIPVLFPASLITPWYFLTYQSSIDFKNGEIKSKDYLSSLDKIKYFPNQTYLFPSVTVSEEDLVFANAVTQNPLINQKIKLFNQNKKFGDALIPTTVLEEKMMNPYLQCQKYKDLLGTSDKEKAFTLLRRMRQEFKKQ